MFPQRLDSSIAYDIAKAMMNGFNRHYDLFRRESARAKHRFETADWHGQQRAQRERIEFYDLRVREASTRLEREFKAGEQPMEVWHQVKLHYIGLLVNHHQPELAETFFNSVTTKILHRSYFHNDFIFVRPAVSTEYIENDEPTARPTYKAWYPRRENLGEVIVQVIESFDLRRPFADLPRDAHDVLAQVEQRLRDMKLRANFQIQVLSSLFFRNKGAYVVGKLINGFSEIPFALPILHDAQGELFIDAILFGEDDLLILFSFARAYFMVDMEIPSAYVQFLRSMMPRKPRAEIYNALGLAKQGKTLFYRDFLQHLRHSTDRFRIAPGIKGMVMLVFTLPSYPYVFKIIKDVFGSSKEMDRATVEHKYQMVKQVDRVGRMADSLEFSHVALPRARFSEELMEELRTLAPSMFEEEGEDVVIKHLYIERRMIPLNLYLDSADEERIEHAVREYGSAIRELAMANIFPGDMLWKNFGVTRYNRVVFYDYDEIEYMTDCNFRKIPPAPDFETEMSGEVWYAVAKNDVFPEEFSTFLLASPVLRKTFHKYHSDLLSPKFWQDSQQKIREGHVEDFFPYPVELRFCNTPPTTGG